MIVKKSAKSGYPDPFASFSEKLKPEYGMAYAEYISSYWFGGGFSNPNNAYNSRRAQMFSIRRWKTGTVPHTQFADRLNIDPDKSSKAFSDKVLAIAPNYINRATDKVADSDFGVSVKGTDRYALEQIEGYKDDLRKAFLYKQYQTQFEQSTGVHIPVPDDIPENEDELDIHAELDYKTNQEIASEEGINRVFDLNNFSEIRNQCVEDYVCHNEMVASVCFDNQIGVSIERIDPIDFITSVNADSSRNSKSVYYQGRVRRYNAVELERKIGRKLTTDEKAQLSVGSLTAGGWQNYTERVVDVLEFYFKTNGEKVFKKRNNKRGGNKLLEKSADWQPIEGRESSKVVEPYETWIGGLYVIGTRLLFNYQEARFMSRLRGKVGSVLPMFIHYHGTTTSIAGRLEKIWEDMHIVFMQMEKSIQNMQIGGFAFDIDALVDLDIGDGIMKPAKTVRVFREGGDYYYSGTSIDGNIQRIPITPLQASDLSQLNNLITQMQFLQRMANDIIGYNEYSDGTANLKNVLASTSEAAQNATNTATKHIFNGWFTFTKDMAETVLNRIRDAIISNCADEILISLIGKVNIEEVQTEYFKHDAQFAVIVNVKSNPEERRMFLTRLEQAVQNGSLEPDDAAKIALDIDNIKRAVQIMGVIKRKRRREAQEAESRKLQEASQLKQQEIALQGQTKAQEIQMKQQADERLEVVRGKIKSEELNFDWMNKFKYLSQEKTWDMRIAGVKGGIEKEKEDRKDFRQAAGNDQLSRVNAQKVIDPTGTTNLEQEEKIKKQLEQQ